MWVVGRQVSSRIHDHKIQKKMSESNKRRTPARKYKKTYKDTYTSKAKQQRVLLPHGNRSTRTKLLPRPPTFNTSSPSDIAMLLRSSVATTTGGIFRTIQ